MKLCHPVLFTIHMVSSNFISYFYVYNIFMPHSCNLANSSYFATIRYKDIKLKILSFPVAQMVEHGASNAKIMGSIPRESKS